ncbi:hypothetical protein DCAR_0727714 [Daucus carota subsp. sativus]|uniref:Cyclin-dependent kinase inhibitor n=1 Tax=Daucus carota subsp. sativus TaxID=79200 RepID=A0A164TCH3_DAUCS|nr:PREDICTED: cyclin-dependent kinase inhibitor 4-like [Daucus carota subsp. sativus]WOH08276.1 hypothetical protein DCAR_0727714 [Daucus carota subsp. sativus]
MGKYMRKSNKGSDVSGVGGPPRFFGGVLTRAKTLALKKAGVVPAPVGDGGAYIQLRSRRLERPVLGVEQKKRRGPSEARARAEEKLGDGSGGEVGSGQLGGDLGSRGSGGGNALPFEANGREEREASFCSSPRNQNVVRTSGSVTRAVNSTEDNGIVLNPVLVPTPHEFEAFFSEAEESQRQQFIKKYNFDPLEEKPLPGRYEWVKVDP